LFENNIDHQTLDALMEAVHDSFQDFRRYLRAKARALNLPTLAWYDLFAPVGESKQSWSYDEARKFIIEQFTDFSSKMGALAKRAFQERWIDAEIRPGKIDVGYCFPLRDDESRILVNYRPTFFDVSYLAHELGHAYHNLNLAKRTQLQRETPLLLHETASTFCQTIVQQAGLQQADTEEKISILNSSLQFFTCLVLETTTWYLFEKDICEHRVRSELSLELLKQKMLEAQLQVYGDALEPDTLHPYDWAAWPHLFAFFSPYAFYNFQYSFGTVFSSGLYGQYQKDPKRFKASFDELLSSTGLAETADLADRFGIDIRTTDFWRSSFDVIRSDIDQFESLVE
jgi:oligoendopeptidase F